MRPRLRLICLALPLSLLLAACDQLGLETPQKEAERKEADAKAVGSACRQAGRAIEDCYNLNAKASKAAVFAGWREMDEYMRENKLDVVKPTVPPPAASKPKPSDDDTDDTDTPDKPSKASDKVADADKVSDKGADKAGDKGDKPSRKPAPKTSIEPAHTD